MNRKCERERIVKYLTMIMNGGNIIGENMMNSRNMIHGSMIDWWNTMSRNTIGGMIMGGNMMGSNMMGSNMMGSNMMSEMGMSCNSSFKSCNKLKHENKKVRSLSCIYF